jgi:hypothetical protein
MINCKLNRDIALGNGQQGDGCMSVSINAGVSDGLYIYNLEDVKNLIFDEDSRPDKTLYIDTIVTSQPFYRVDATNIQYTEEYDDHSYSHQLTAQIKNVRNEIEEILEAAVHGKYLVAFKVIGEKNYRLIGWKEGLSLDEQLSIQKDNNAFTLTFKGETTYPEMECDKSNFDLANKVFDPTFEPLFEAGKITCSNGWATANYVVKVNAAGQALDAHNKLVQFSGLQQDAYKLQGVSDGDYNIIGTYTSDEYIEGKAVKVYDTSLCNISCSVNVSPNIVTFNSAIQTSAITITSSSDWEVVTYPSTVTLSRTYGGVNDQLVYVYSNGYCGAETITFKAKNGQCTSNLRIFNNMIKLDDTYYYPNRTSSMTLTPIACCNYTATVSEGNVVVNSDGSFTVSGVSGRDSEKRLTVTLSCGGETKEVTLVIHGIDTARGRRIISEYCETV